MERENGRNVFAIEVSSMYGLFTTPATKCSGDKASYPVPTYEALKGILKSIYWKPTFDYEIMKVRIMNKIRLESIGYNIPKLDANPNDLAYYTYLKNPRYQVMARIVWDDGHPELESDRNMTKHMNILRRAIKSGGRYPVCMGVSECPAEVTPCKFGEGKGIYDKVEEINVGLMFHSFLYPNQLQNPQDYDPRDNRIEILYDDVVIHNGIIDFRPSFTVPSYYRYTTHVNVPPQKRYEDRRNFTTALEEEASA